MRRDVAAQVDDDEHRVVARAAQVRDDVIVGGRERNQPARRERDVLLPDVNEPAIQVEQRVLIGLLRGDVDARRVLLRFLPRRARREADARARAPLHRRPEPRVGLVARHPDLLAVVDERQAGERQQQRRGHTGSRAVPA